MSQEVVEALDPVDVDAPARGKIVPDRSRLARLIVRRNCVVPMCLQVGRKVGGCVLHKRVHPHVGGGIGW